MRFNICVISPTRVPYLRLHDVGGLYAAADMWIFERIPDFDRRNRPASYDFAFTDVLMAEIVKAEWSRFIVWVSPSRTTAQSRCTARPPADPLKWAKICDM